MTKKKNVVLFYSCNRLSEKVIGNREKIQRRLQHAISDMVEDGFENFIMPFDERSPLPTSFVDAIVAEKIIHPTITLSISFPCMREEPFAKAPAARHWQYTQYADQIIYTQMDFSYDMRVKQTEQLLKMADAIITYYDLSGSQLNRIIGYAQQNRLPFINIT